MEWGRFDGDVETILECTQRGSMESKMNAMTTIVYSVALERFGELERKAPSKEVPNRRTEEIALIRRDLRNLAKQYKEASDLEKEALSSLRADLRARLNSLRKAENHRRKRRERAKKRASFTRDPFSFTKKTLGDKRSGKLECLSLIHI